LSCLPSFFCSFPSWMLLSLFHSHLTSGGESICFLLCDTLADGDVAAVSFLSNFLPLVHETNYSYL